MKTTSTLSFNSNSVNKNGSSFFSSAEPSRFLVDLYRKLEISHPKFHKMDRLSQLGFLGAHILLEPLKDELAANDESISILMANASSSLETDHLYWNGVNDEGTGSPAKFVYTLPNIVICEICIYWKQYGETQFLVLPEYDEQRLISEAEILLSNSTAKFVLVGWAEVSGEKLDGRFMLLSKE